MNNKATLTHFSKQPLFEGNVNQGQRSDYKPAIGKLRACLILAAFLCAGLVSLFGLPGQNTPLVSAATMTSAIQSSASIQVVATKAKCQAVNNNPWCYNFVHGSLIYRPKAAFCSYFNCVSDFWRAIRGYVVKCGNGKYSHSGGVRGVCSRDKKVVRILYAH